MAVVPSTDPVKWHRTIDGKLYHIMGRPMYVEETTGLTILCHGASMWRGENMIGRFPNVQFTFFADEWNKD